MARFIKDKAKKKRELQAKTVRIYQEYILDGKEDGEARELCLERLDCLGLTPRKLKNYVENPAGISNPKAMALNEGRINVWLEKTTADIDEVRCEVDDKLDDLDDREPEEMVAVVESGKVKTSKPVWLLKIELMERKMGTLETFFKAIKALRGNAPLINIDMRSGMQETTFEDLGHQIRGAQKANNMEVFDEQDNSAEQTDSPPL